MKIFHCKRNVDTVSHIVALNDDGEEVKKQLIVYNVPIQ